MIWRASFLSLCLALLLTGQASAQLPAWMEGHWNTRSEDRAAGLISGIIEIDIELGESSARLWLPSGTLGGIDGPFEASSIRRFQRDEQNWVSLTFSRERAPDTDRVVADLPGVPQNTFVVPQQDGDELRYTLSTGLNTIGAPLTLSLSQRRPDAGTLTFELQLPGSTSTQATRALDGLWAVEGDAPGQQRAGVRSRALLNRGDMVGPETWVRITPTIMASLSNSYEPLPAPGETRDLTLRLAGVLMPESVNTIQFQDQHVEWTGDYRQISLAEAEISITVDGALASRAVTFHLDGAEAVWFPEPPELEPVMAGFSRPLREDVEIAVERGVSGEAVHLKVLYDRPPMLNTLTYLVGADRGTDPVTVPVFRSARDPRLFLSDPLVLVAEGDQAPDSASLAEVSEHLGAVDQALALPAGPLRGRVVAFPEPVLAQNHEIVAVMEIGQRPRSLYSEAASIADRCIARGEGSDDISFEDYAALLAFRDALIVRLDAARALPSPQTDERRTLVDREVRQLLDAGFLGHASPLAEQVIAAENGRSAPLADWLTAEEIQRRLGRDPDETDLWDDLRAQVEAALEARALDRTAGVTSIAELDPCDPETMLATLATLIPSHGDVVGGSILRLVEDGEGQWPRWRADRTLVGRINGLPALADDIDASSALTRQTVITVGSLASAVVGGGLLALRATLPLVTTYSLFGVEATGLAIGELGILGADIAFVSWDVNRYYEQAGLVEQLESFGGIVPHQEIVAARRRQQEAAFEAVLGAALLAPGAVASPVLRNVQDLLYTGRTIVPTAREAAQIGAQIDELDFARLAAAVGDQPMETILGTMIQGAQAERDAILGRTLRALENGDLAAQSAIARSLPGAQRFLAQTLNEEQLASRIARGIEAGTRAEQTLLGGFVRTLRRDAYVHLAAIYYFNCEVLTAAGFDCVARDDVTDDLTRPATRTGTSNADSFSPADLMPWLIWTNPDPLFEAATVDTDEITPRDRDEMIAITRGPREIGDALFEAGLRGATLIAPRAIFYSEQETSPQQAVLAREILRDDLAAEELAANPAASTWLSDVFGQTFARAIADRQR